MDLALRWEASCCHRAAYAVSVEMDQAGSWEVAVVPVRHHWPGESVPLLEIDQTEDH